MKRKIYLLLFIALLLSFNTTLQAQTPVYPNPLTGICSTNVPHFVVNLAGQPDSVWTSPNVTRQATCCGDPGTGSWTFVSFTVTLDPNVAEVSVGLAPSDPGGASSGYWIDVCGPYASRIEGGTEVCITGPGPHNFWYGKSGGNANSAYTIKQIPKPTFPDDDSVRIGCSLPLDIYGLNAITMTSGNPTYDSWLDMSDPSHPIFTPGSTAPPFIDFTITGTQIASASCGLFDVSEVVRIYIYQPLDIDILPSPANFCEGGSLSLSATVNNPVGSVTYNWVNNTTGLTISTTTSTPAISVAGNYTLYVSDVLTRYGCSPTGITIPVTETLAPVVNAGTDDTVCSTSPIALLSGTASSPYSSVLWTSSTGGTFTGATTLTPTYTASATDITNGFADLTLTVNGCVSVSDVVHIVIDKGPQYTLTLPTLACSNSTGLVSVNITSGGGSPWTPISYYWSTSGTPGTSSETFGAGTYSVTVVDEYGCGSNTPFTLTAPPALTLVMSSTDATPTGSATATAGGGTPVPGYTYSWVNSLGAAMGTTSTIVGLPTDYYVVTVTDGNGCTITGSTVVNDPLCLGFNATALGTDASCNGGNDGSATVTGTGGAGSTGPYSYIWLTSPVQTTITATGLTAGVYDVIVTDMTLGCRDVANAVVGEPTALGNTMTHTDNTVIGGTAGTATANPSGGTSPYTYSWSTAPVQTTATATGLAAGTYTVTISDANLCPLTDNVIINEPPCNNFVAAVTATGVSCNGDTDGSATVVVAHGTAPYTYSLDGGAFVPNPSGSYTGLSAGMHTLSIMDQSNCVVIQNFNITEPSVLSIGLNPTNLTCYNSANGTIDLTVSGGTYPYTFDWVNNDGNVHFATTEDVIALNVGTYSVTVTDANGCSVTESAGLTQPNEIEATVDVNDITCFGDDNGSIDVTISGGQTPYTYSWIFPTGTSTSEDLSGLSPGQYILSVSDANNCSSKNIVDVYINEPAQVQIFSTITNCPVPGATTALVQVDSISGGTDGPYQLSFDGGAPLAAGIDTASLTIGATHTVTATDANGCTVSAPTTIVINPAVTISSISYGACIPAGATTINITVNPAGGDGGPYEVSTDNGATYNAAGTYVISVPVGNTYQVVVRDGLDCESVPSTIVIPNEILVSTVVDSVNCLGANDGSILLSATGGTAPYNVSWTGPVTGNPAGNEITASGGTYTIGSLTAGTYSVTVTDANGCTKVTSVSVGTVVDLINPTIACPGNITTNTDLNTCTALVSFGTIVGTDNCPGAITTQTAGLATGSLFPEGTTTNTFLVTDAQGRTATCTFTVTVNDVQLPSITCPATVTVNNDAGVCGAASASVSLGTPVTSDNCAVLSVTNNAPANYPVGTTVVTWTVTDVNGNVNTCNQNVIVNDNEDPIITSCPATVNVNTDAGFCYASGVSLGTLTATDNCTTFTITNDAPTSYPVGTTTVTWTVTDAAGNSTTCTQSVIVTDNQAPSLTCPTAITQNNDAGACGSSTVSLGTPLVGDNCGVASVVNDAPVFFPVDTTVVTWTVTDVNGNVSTCTQTVIIVDNELPLITVCPADVNTTADPGNCHIDSANVSLGAPTVTDNCGIATIVNNAPATFPVGTTTVTWTITDVNGNVSTCTQLVNVTDSELPVITSCPDTVNVNADAGFCYASGVSLGTLTATDNCGSPTITNNAPTTFPVGTTVVTWTVTDVHGNSTNCTQLVNVTDNQNPTIICPANITQANDSLSCGSATVNLGTPGVLDNCGIASVVNDAPAFFPVDTTVVTWTVTDVNGNVSTCTQTVIITDDENPNIVTCVLDQVVVADASCEFALADYTALITATDNCGYTITQSPVSGTVITTGTTNVVITVTDNAGNSVTCNFDVTVNDTIDPVISGCPANIAINTDSSVCGAVATWTMPLASDNCGVTMTSTHNSGDLFPVGTTTVTYTAVDPAGNTVTCSFDVTVTDNELPTVLTCQANIGSCDSLVTFSAPTASDNCGITSIVQTAGLPSGSIFPVGTTTIVYEITDVNGNVSTCTFDVTIHPTPFLTYTSENVSCFGFGDGSIDLTVNSGTAPFSFNWSNSDTTEDIDTLIPNQYIVTVVDTFGCSTSAMVIITQPEALTTTFTSVNVDCYGNNNGSIDVTVTDGTLPYNYMWNTADTTQDIDTLAPNTYSLIVTDGNGCIDSIGVVITQPDSLQASATTVPANCAAPNGMLDLTVNGGTEPYNYAWVGGMTSEDLLGFATGTYTVTVTDALGCQMIFSDSIGTINKMSLSAEWMDLRCFNDSTGNIDISINNGNGPFTYSWSSGDTTEDLTNLAAGLYTITVTDSNLCVASLDITIVEPTLLEVELTSPVDGNGYNVSTYGGENGSIDMTVTGGTSPYNYTWIPNGETTEDINNLLAGEYNVIVTDANGCVVTEKIVLTEPYLLAMPTGYSPNGDGANDYFVVKGIEAYPDNEIQVYNRWGNIVYKESGYTNQWNGQNNSGDELPDGTYYVVLVLKGTDIKPLTGYVDLRRSR